jgi:hypothetical protein
LYIARTLEGKNEYIKNKEKINGELLVGKENEMMIVKNIVS